MDSIGFITMPEQLRTNFINKIGTLVWPVFLLLLFFIFFILCLSAYFIHDAYTSSNVLPDKEAYLEKLKEKSVVLQKEKLMFPAKEQILELNETVVRLNSVGTVMGRNISTLLSELEILLPKSTHIQILDHKRKKGILLLIAEAKAVDHLTTFLKKLENSNTFASVLLARQSKDDSSGMYRYELRLVENPI